MKYHPSLLLLLLGATTSLVAFPMVEEGSSNFSARTHTSADTRAGTSDVDDAAMRDPHSTTLSENESLAETASDVARGTSDQGITENSETDNTPISRALTLQDFREALAANHDAPRFIIARNAEVPSTFTIEPAEVVTGNRGQNLDIINALRDALEKEHSSESRALVSQVIGQNNLLSYGNSHLSAGRLFEILNRVDDATQLTSTESADEQDINKYLQDTIHNNIYTIALAEVALITDQQLSGLADGIQYQNNNEAKEWRIAEEAARMDIAKSERLLENTKRETERCLISNNNQTKKVTLLAEKLAEARRETAHATLHAIKFKKSSLSTTAENALRLAQDAENEARIAYNKAKITSPSLAEQRISFCCDIGRYSSSSSEENKTSKEVLGACSMNLSDPLSPSQNPIEANKAFSVSENDKIAWEEAWSELMLDSIVTQKIELPSKIFDLDEDINFDFNMVDAAMTPLFSNKLIEFFGAKLLKRITNLKEFIISEITTPTETDTRRWNAREYADQLAQEGVESAANLTRLLDTRKKEDQLSKENTEYTSPLRNSYTDFSDVERRDSSRGASFTCYEEPAITKTPLLDDIFKWRPTITSVMSESAIFSDIESATLDVDNTAYESIAAEKEWISLALLAEKDRIGRGGQLVDQQVAIDAWLKTDKAAVASRCQWHKIIEEESRAARIKDNWEAETKRWSARKKADDEIEAKQEWLTLANLHSSIVSLDPRDEIAIKEARKKLKHADQAVNDFCNMLINKYQEIKQYAASTNEKSRSHEEIENYKLDLLTSKQTDLVRPLVIMMSKYQKVKPYESTRAWKRRRNREAGIYQVDLVTKKEADITYCFEKYKEHFESDNIGEENALKKYANITERDALKAARKKTAGAEQAWSKRVIQADEACKVKEATYSNNINSPFANDNLSIAQRMTAIANIDRKALEAFKRETARLADIEATWINTIEAEERRAKIERDIAVKSYAEGDRRVWILLPLKEQYIHNNMVKVTNAAYQTIAIANAKLLQNLSDKIKQAYNKAEASWINKATALENVTQAWIEWDKLQATEIERKRALEWPTLSSKEREKSLQLRLEEIEERKKMFQYMQLTFAEKRAKSYMLWETASKIENIATQLANKALNSSYDKAISCWDKAIKQATEAQNAWAQAAEFYQLIERWLTPSSSLFKWNIISSVKDFEIAKNNRLKWFFKEFLYKSKKAAGIATFLQKTALTISGHEAITRWDEAIKKTRSAAAAYATAHTVASDQLLISYKRFFAFWNKEIEIVENQKKVWEATILWYEANKAESIAYFAKLNAVTAPLSQKAALWDHAIQTASAVQSAWITTQEAYQNGMNTSSEKSKTWWKQESKKAENNKNFWASLGAQWSNKKLQDLQQPSK